MTNDTWSRWEQPKPWCYYGDVAMSNFVSYCQMIELGDFRAIFPKLGGGIEARPRGQSHVPKPTCKAFRCKQGDGKPSGERQAQSFRNCSPRLGDSLGRESCRHDAPCSNVRLGPQKTDKHRFIWTAGGRVFGVGKGGAVQNALIPLRRSRDLTAARAGCRETWADTRERRLGGREAWADTGHS